MPEVFVSFLRSFFAIYAESRFDFPYVKSKRLSVYSFLRTAYVFPFFVLHYVLTLHIGIVVPFVSYGGRVTMSRIDGYIRRQSHDLLF